MHTQVEAAGPRVRAGPGAAVPGDGECWLIQCGLETEITIAASFLLLYCSGSPLRAVSRPGDVWQGLEAFGLSQRWGVAYVWQGGA